MTQKIDENLTEREIRLKMVVDIAHELRTPLGGIVGMNELLLSSQLDPEQKQFSETIHDSAKSMLQLLNDFVELAKLDAEKVVIRCAPTHLQTLLDECSYALRKLLKSHNIELNIVFSEGLPDTIGTDENCLRQTIISIVTGATKYVESGTIRIDIAAAAHNAKKSGISFKITLPPNTVNRNGQPLFTVIASENSPVLRFDSTWLRLSIAQHLLNLLQATVSIQDNTMEFVIQSN